MKNLLIFLFVLALAISGQAQNKLSGIVTDKENGEPLTGVSVYVPDLLIGIATDEKGRYQLSNLPNGELIIQFSYIGFQTVSKQIYLNRKDRVVNIEMTPQVIQGQEVVISGNFTSTQHENTIKISTIGIERISTSGHPSLIESLAEVPGVSLISKGPGVVTPVIRGLSLSNILVLKNGMPMENFQFSENHPYLIDENGLQQVEIIKGPASLIYGSGAVGGVINLVPEPVAAQGKIEGDFTMNFYGNTRGVLSNIGLKGHQNGVVWGLRGGINTSRDYVQGNGNYVPNTRFNRYNIKADVGLLRKKGTFRLFYEYSGNKFGMAVPPAVQLVTENAYKNEVWYQDLTDHMIISQNKLFLGNTKLDIDVSYENNKRKLFGDPVIEPFKLVDMTLQTVAYRIKANHNFSERLRAIFGAQGMYQNNKNFDAPDHVLPDAEINEISLYGIVQYARERYKIEAGLRYSFNAIYVPRQKADGHDDETHYIEYNGKFNNLSASAGASVYVNKQNILRINVASAFRSPNLPELTQYGLHGTRFEMGNPDLKTQQNVETDLGYHLHTRHTSLDLSVFYNHINNYIYLAPTGDTTEAGLNIYQYTQSNAQLYGGEARFHIHPHPAHWLHILSTYAYVIGEQRGGGYLPRIPAQQLYLELKLEKDTWKNFRNIYLSGGVRFVFDQNRPSEFELATDGYNLLNLGFGFGVKAGKQLIRFDVKATNLLNIDYYSHLSTLKDMGFYDMGRNISFSVKIPFVLKN